MYGTVLVRVPVNWYQVKYCQVMLYSVVYYNIITLQNDEKSGWGWKHWLEQN